LTHQCYRAAVGAMGIQPSEFWDMSPQEFWLLAQDRMPEPKKGGMAASTFNRLTRMLENA